MNRKTINIIRFVFEELLPPIIRDSFIFRLIVKYLYRSDRTHEILKSDILKISNEDYIKYYADMPEVQGETDNSKECIDEILKNIIPYDVIDVGCGRGYLLNEIKKSDNSLKLYGAEIFKNKKLLENEKKNNLIIFEKGIENVSKINKKFDTVICTHVLEHILDFRSAYLELKKICNKRLIIIVPKERPYKYTFNGHLNFFPYEWSFINAIRPLSKSYKIKNINRDFVYIEDND